jgi:hypothetical protein
MISIWFFIWHFVSRERQPDPGGRDLSAGESSADPGIVLFDLHAKYMVGSGVLR